MAKRVSMSFRHIPEDRQDEFRSLLHRESERIMADMGIFKKTNYHKMEDYLPKILKLLDKGWSQVRICEKLGLQQRTVSDWLKKHREKAPLKS